MADTKKTTEIMANVAIVIVAIVVGIIAIKQYVLPPKDGRPPEAKVGQKLGLSNVEWAPGSRSLVLALSTTCHYCSESAPFYQRLLRQSDRAKAFRMVAILPQSPSEATAYLNKLNLAITIVRQSSLARIPVAGTPTILLVNDQGIVQKIWTGKLPPESESEVMKEVGCTQAQFCE